MCGVFVLLTLLLRGFFGVPELLGAAPEAEEAAAEEDAVVAEVAQTASVELQSSVLCLRMLTMVCFERDLRHAEQQRLSRRGLWTASEHPAQK